MLVCFRGTCYIEERIRSANCKLSLYTVYSSHANPNAKMIGYGDTYSCLQFCCCRAVAKLNDYKKKPDQVFFTQKLYIRIIKKYILIV